MVEGVQNPVIRLGISEPKAIVLQDGSLYLPSPGGTGALILATGRGFPKVLRVETTTFGASSWGLESGEVNKHHRRQNIDSAGNCDEGCFTLET